MQCRKSNITYSLAMLGLTLLTPGFSRASDLDDAERELNQARIDRAQAEVDRVQAESDLRSVEAANAALAARKKADQAEFARFEAEDRATQAEQARQAAEDRAKFYALSRVGPPDKHSAERKVSRSPSRGYVESYEEVQERTSWK